MNKLRAILILLMLVAFPVLVSAAKIVPGQMPVLPPLQQPVENAKPNVSGSIQSQNAVFQEPAAGGEQTAGNTKNSQPDSFVDKTSILNLPSGSGASVTWIIFALVALALGGGLGYWLHVRRK